MPGSAYFSLAECGIVCIKTVKTGPLGTRNPTLRRNAGCLGAGNCPGSWAGIGAGHQLPAVQPRSLSAAAILARAESPLWAI